MNKMAIFVEGSTELHLLSNLIVAIGNKSKLAVELVRQRGLSIAARTQIIRTLNRSTSTDRIVTIVDCGGDSAVKSMMLDSYANLTANAGYSRILCVRDVYPTATYGEITKLEKGLAFKVPTKPVTVEFILSVMECEAWIISEHTHFPKLSNALTCENIASSLGFNPATDSIDQRPNPAADLEKCYALAGIRYKKGNSKQLKTVDAAELYLSVANRFAHLQRFCEIIDEFLS